MRFSGRGKSDTKKNRQPVFFRAWHLCAKQLFVPLAAACLRSRVIIIGWDVDVQLFRLHLAVFALS
jgi:hypothetical protein